METFGGKLPNQLLLFKQKLIEEGVSDPNYAPDSERKIAEKAVLEEYLACLMLSGADNGRYLILKINMDNIMLLGSDK